MSEWIEANIYFSRNPNHFLLNFIKPLITELENEEQLISFHFFGEPGPRILLRILSLTEVVDEIQDRIRSWESHENISQIQFRDYHGEESSFGADSWETAYRFFEASSRIRLDMIDENIEKGPNFNLIAFNHYFLNACGLSIPNEATIHADMMIERLYTQRHYDLRDLNEKIQRIESRLQQIEDSLSSHSST